MVASASDTPPADRRFDETPPVAPVREPPRPEDSSSERLAAIAATLFHRKGYAGTSTRELAALLGMQNSSLYHHYSSKEEILFSICQRSLAHINKEVRAALADSDESERLQRVIEAHLSCVLGDRDMQGAMLIEFRSLSREHRSIIGKARSDYVRFFEDLIRDEQVRGVLRSDVDARYLTLELLSILNWALFWFNPEEHLPPPELGKLLGRLFAEGANHRAE